jgi:hypothetical protein
VLATRSWRWLRTRIISLLDRPGTFVRFPVKDGEKFTIVPSTRLGYALKPPSFE